MEENQIQENYPNLASEGIQEVPLSIKRPTRNIIQSLFGNIQPILENSGHIVEVLKAAMPYVDSRNIGTIETIVKATDLLHTTRNRSSAPAELSAASLSSKPMDLEGMLSSIREVSTVQERETIDKFLGMFKMKKLYDTYTMMTQNKDLMKAASFTGQSNSNTSMNPNMMDTLKTMLPPDQAATFDTMSTMVQLMNMMGTNHPTTSSSNKEVTKTPVSPIPNYTYAMNQASRTEPTPKIDNEYLNQFAPQAMPEATAPQTTGNSAFTDPNTMNQLYQNIQMIYQALNSAGLNGTSSPSTVTTNTTVPTNNATMMNAITTLANSGLRNKNMPNKTNNVRSMPIPNANQYAPTTSNALDHNSNAFDNPYNRVTPYRNIRDLTPSSDTLEAASLDSQ